MIEAYVRKKEGEDIFHDVYSVLYKWRDGFDVRLLGRVHDACIYSVSQITDAPDG